MAGMSGTAMPQFIRDWVPISFLDMFRFSGRSRRREAAGYIVLYTILVHGPVSVAGDKTDALRIALGLLFGLILWFPQFALFVRRMNDQDRSSWWLAIPVAETIVSAALVLQPDTGHNFSVTFLIWTVSPNLGGASGMLVAAALALIAAADFVLLFSPGTLGPNRHGVDPRGMDSFADLRVRT
jgi:uncharacterized membrane protein YhaH (DUF805 family)